MTQEDEKLLLKDICDRIPYGVIGKFKNSDQQIYGIFHDLLEGWQVSGITLTESISNVKPYLFPLSSMTEEQFNEMYNYCYNAEREASKFSNGELKIIYNYELIKFEWLNMNKFDYRGLIPRGLAKDATGLNIY